MRFARPYGGGRVRAVLFHNIRIWKLKYKFHTPLPAIAWNELSKYTRVREGNVHGTNDANRKIFKRKATKQKIYLNAQPSLHCTSQSRCLLHVNTKRNTKNPSFFVTHIHSERKRFSLPVYFLCAKSAFRCPLAIFTSIQLDSTRLNIKLNGFVLVCEYIKFTQERLKPYIIVRSAAQCVTTREILRNGCTHGTWCETERTENEKNIYMWVARVADEWIVSIAFRCFSLD